MLDNIELKVANSKLRIALLEHAQTLAKFADKHGAPEFLEQAEVSYELAEKLK